MIKTRVALVAGLRRGWIELRQQFTTRSELVTHVVMFVFLVALIFLTRDSHGAGRGVSVGVFLLPGLLGMIFGMNGMVGIAQVLTAEREDGTLLRAKTLPGGMPAYLIGKIFAVSGAVVISAASLLIPSLLFLHGLALTPRTAVLLVVVVVAGLVATLPLGAVLGATLSSPRALGFVIIPVMGMTVISGIFFPLSALPRWLQVIGQLFPMYWLGLGTRSALLPASAALQEIHGSWRTPETLGVLLAWAFLGLAIAPMVLRRMARRESGSSVATRKEKALQRTA